MGVCRCLQTCNSVVNIAVMGLVLGQSLIVISSPGVLLYAKVSVLYNVLRGCRCLLKVNYIVYKHFDRLLHIGSLNTTCVQNFRSLTLMVFEILGFKLKKKNKKKNWRNGLFATSPMFMVQLTPHFDLSYHPAVLKVDSH